MDISLIKQLNETVREKDEYEVALEKAGIKSNPVKESIDDYFPDDEDLSDVEDEYAGDEFDDNRMVDAYAPRHEYTRQGTSTGMSDDELENSIADDTTGYGDDPESLLIKRQEVKDRLRDIDDRPTANIDRDPTGAPASFENEEDTMEIQRIVDEYATSDLSDEEIFDAVGNDLEMLEYPPEEVEKLVPVIMSMIKKNTKYMDMSDALADGPQVDDAGNEYIP